MAGLDVGQFCPENKAGDNNVNPGQKFLVAVQGLEPRTLRI
jgi:hypothetical protein